WLLLLVTLPAGSTTARMRLWRAVNALGCATLRDGAYLLPASPERAERLNLLATDVRRHQGEAWLLAVSADGEQERAFALLFDRS
ncbi:Chromate resistance protein ChrB, partial [Acinetobacter baumannii]